MAFQNFRNLFLFRNFSPREYTSFFFDVLFWNAICNAMILILFLFYKIMCTLVKINIILVIMIWAIRLFSFMPMM